MDGSLAVAILVILSFAAFVVWAKSESGRNTLRSSLGEPQTVTKLRKGHKKRHVAARPPARPSAPAKRTTRR